MLRSLALPFLLLVTFSHAVSLNCYDYLCPTPSTPGLCAEIDRYPDLVALIANEPVTILKPSQSVIDAHGPMTEDEVRFLLGMGSVWLGYPGMYPTYLNFTDTDVPMRWNVIKKDGASLTGIYSGPDGTVRVQGTHPCGGSSAPCCDNGDVFTIDGLMLPETSATSLSSVLTGLGLTDFNDLIAVLGLTAMFETSAGATLFAPTNDALARFPLDLVPELATSLALNHLHASTLFTMGAFSSDSYPEQVMNSPYSAVAIEMAHDTLSLSMCCPSGMGDTCHGSEGFLITSNIWPGTPCVANQENHDNYNILRHNGIVHVVDFALPPLPTANHTIFQHLVLNNHVELAQMLVDLGLDTVLKDPSASVTLVAPTSGLTGLASADLEYHTLEGVWEMDVLTAGQRMISTALIEGRSGVNQKMLVRKDGAVFFNTDVQSAEPPTVAANGLIYYVDTPVPRPTRSLMDLLLDYNHTEFSRQVEAATLAFGEVLSVGGDVVVFAPADDAITSTWFPLLSDELQHATIANHFAPFAGVLEPGFFLSLRSGSYVSAANETVVVGSYSYSSFVKTAHDTPYSLADVTGGLVLATDGVYAPVSALLFAFNASNHTAHHGGGSGGATTAGSDTTDTTGTPDTTTSSASSSSSSPTTAGDGSDGDGSGGGVSGAVPRSAPPLAAMACLAAVWLS